MVLAETDRRPREQLINNRGFKILPPDNFDSFKETVQQLSPSANRGKPYVIGSCDFLVPFPIGKISVGIERNNGGATLFALISPSWLRGEHILDFIRQKSDLKTQEGPEDGLEIIERNILMEAWSVTRGNGRDVFPPYGEQIIINSEKIPIGDGWPLFEGLINFSRCTEKFVDWVFAMTGKPCPPGKAISIKFPIPKSV